MTPRRNVLPFSLRRILSGMTNALAGVGLVVLVLGISPLSQWLVDQWQVEPILGHADVIVILGGGAGREGLHLHSSARLFYGMRLYHQGLAPRVGFTGGTHRPFSVEHSEGSAFLEAWKEFGLPVSATVVDRTALNTYENAVRMREILGGNQRILLVTSSGHMRRARDTFTKQGFVVLPAPLPPQSPRFHHPASRWTAGAGLLYEAMAWVRYRFRGWL